MKKRPIHYIAAALLLTAMLGSTALAAGTVTYKTIQAQYRNIQIVLDGQAITPKDVTGKVVEPFISDGTTYVPVRAIGEALGREVSWDGTTNTVYIGKKPGEDSVLMPYMVSTSSKIYDGTDPHESFSVLGNTYTTGVVLKKEVADAYAVWNTNAEYKSMTFSIAYSGDGKGLDQALDVVLDIYLDGNFSSTRVVKWDSGATTVTVPLNYAANVKLNVAIDTTAKNAYAHSYTQYTIYDISFSK